jgi:hypothetical protein
MKLWVFLLCKAVFSSKNISSDDSWEIDALYDNAHKADALYDNSNGYLSKRRDDINQHLKRKTNYLEKRRDDIEQHLNRKTNYLEKRRDDIEQHLNSSNNCLNKRRDDVNQHLDKEHKAVDKEKTGRAIVPFGLEGNWVNSDGHKLHVKGTKCIFLNSGKEFKITEEEGNFVLNNYKCAKNQSSTYLVWTHDTKLDVKWVRLRKAKTSKMEKFVGTVIIILLASIIVSFIKFS